MPTRRTLAVGTRGSALALAQTEIVVTALRAIHPELCFEVVRITTRGDALADVPLSAIGGRGVFTSAIEDALREGRIDLAVHSAKDLPSELPLDVQIAAFLARADARDVLVSHAEPLEALPAGARVGTSSPRRACQLRALRTDLDIREMRGNIDTRIRKFADGEYDAIVLAAAGLERLGLTRWVTEWLSVDRMLPAVGQGALAVETRADDPFVAAVVAPLAHAPTDAALRAERAFLATLGAGCTAAVGAHATYSAEGALTLAGLIGTVEGQMVRGARTGAAADATSLGRSLAEQLLADGGARFLAMQRPGSVALDV